MKWLIIAAVSLAIIVAVVLLVRQQDRPATEGHAAMKEEVTPLPAQAPQSSEAAAPTPTLVAPAPPMEFISVTGGCYQMGDTFGDGTTEEKPVHEVCVHDFEIGKYEVTQMQWRAVMGGNPSVFIGCGDDCPVENVSWDAMQEFIRRYDQMTGSNHRLPTEAEWEYAARGGGNVERYPGGSDLDAIAWYSANSNQSTHPVGQKKANRLGIYDMIGNVEEWCQDWYAGDYYIHSSRDNPQGPPSGTMRVVRGGCWMYDARFARVSLRHMVDARGWGPIYGFRLVRGR